MQQYLDLLQHVLDHGTPKSDRTGTGTLSTFGYQMRFNLDPAPPPVGGGFPLVTTKKLHLRSIIHELLWFLRGDTNVRYLHEHGVTIWDEWAAPPDSPAPGELGPVYGYQWRSWPAQDRDGRVGYIDQISQVIEQIRTNPDSRRLIVSAWNVGQIDQMALPPCHLLFQFYVTPAGEPGGQQSSEPGGPPPRQPVSSGAEDDPARKARLSCQLYQRSADVFLGVPFNIASYALLTMMVAQVTGLAPGEFIHTFGDAHLYRNHLDQAREQLGREPRSLPTMKLNENVTNIFDFKYEDFKLMNYDPHPAIKAPIAV